MLRIDMNDAWSPFEASRLRARVREIQSQEVKEWDWTEYAVWLRRHRRLKVQSTLRARLNALKRMSEHPAAPVTLRGRGPDILESFANFVAYREEEEGKGYGALSNDYKSFRDLAAFLGLDPRGLPRPPPTRKPTKEMLPSPEEVHRLLHYNFTGGNPRRDYTNALLQYILAFDFAIGVRAPSELFSQRLDLQHFDPAKHLLVVTRDKQGGREDRLYVEPEYLCCSQVTLSLANYLRWRDKLDPLREHRAFFLRANGQPFRSKESLARFLWQHVPRTEFPWFYPYIGRHWCATARLVEWGFDYHRVADWLGHEDVEMLRAYYDRDARIAKKVYGSHWLYRAFFGRPRRRGPTERS